MIGNLGPIVFKVANRGNLTFRDLSFSLSPRYGTHEPMMGIPKKEFIGPGGQSYSFTMDLNFSKEINPRDQVERLMEYANSGTILPFFLGEKPFGNFVITDLGGNFRFIDNKGIPWNGDVQISIEEYGDDVETIDNYG